ncbi:MAG: NBR1-Ig-like domain-containing protein [Anaerolineales bacterium]|nr:NBR1-Ig-like domain-containing protein [Anaerolineales bacterium]MCX7754984.1 NBR1-Ig-like domain-containing protein [Anaerolineales bacterium]MDW8277362.1 NBR1-Ig-like domain-containing protein [Anaerolineales bacterium]
MSPKQLTLLLLWMMFLLSACNLSAAPSVTPSVHPNTVFTAAAQTVEAQLTQNALLRLTTPRPAESLPTATLAPLPSTQSPPAAIFPTPDPSLPCDAARFVADVTVPDGSLYAPGATFIKTWKIQNIGACVWDTSYSLVFDSGERMGGPDSLPLPGTVAPGEEIDLSIPLTAPSKTGKYRGYWRLQNPAGQTVPIEQGYNGRSFFVEIQVRPGTGGGTPSPFTVTTVTFAVSHSGSCAAGKYTVTATITVNKAGTVTYTWIRSDGATGAAHRGSLTFDKAGTQTITFEWPTGASGLWVDLYIEEPNQQQFGRALLNCP